MATHRLLKITACSASTLATAMCLLSPAAAQAQVVEPNATSTTQAQDEGNTEIVVTGIRASLETALEVKRNSNGVVDAISAEDIGKFPDTNLAESLQRVPGVSINRVNGEGSQVTARGFTANFNLVTVNGRQMPTAHVNVVGGDQDVDFGRATSRSFDFSNLASEGVSLLEVYKTGRSAIPSGGIGATINIVTRRPLDGARDGFRGSIGAKALFDGSHEIAEDTARINPEVSGLLEYSNPNDTFGVSLFGSYQKRESAAISATSNAWNIERIEDFLDPANGRVNASTVVENAPATGTLVSFPNDSRYHYSESERERLNGSAVLQFRPTDGLTLTADALFFLNKNSEERADQANWFNRPFGRVVFDAADPVATTVFLSETISGVKDTGFEQQYRSAEDELQSYGLSAEWELNDRLTLTADGHYGVANSRPNSPNGTTSTLVGIGAPVITAHSVDYSGAIPQQTISIDDGPRGNGNGELDLGDLGTQVARTNTSSQRHRIYEGRLDLAYALDGNSEIRFGGQYLDSKMTSERVQTQQQLGDWGITYPGDVAALAPGLVDTYCLACKFNEFDPGAQGASLVAFRGNAVDLYDILSAAYAADGNPFLAGAQPGNAVGVTSRDFDTVREKTWAVYGQVTWNGELGNMPAQVVAGVRYEKTDVVSDTIQAIPTAIVWQSDNDFSNVIGSGTTSLTLTGGYDNVLPALDFSIEPVRDVKLRASFSRTLARPEYGNLFAATSVNAPPRPGALGGVASGNRGNPNLLPLVSDNLDLSAEWYFAPSSYIAVGFFEKRVKNFVGTGQVDRQLFDLRDPSSGAPGSRSGTARERLAALGADISDVNLFTYTALLVQNGGNVAAADATFNANRGPDGSLNQAFIDSTLAAVDVTADANDPFFTFAVNEPINNREANIHGFEISGQYFLGTTGLGISGSYTKVYGNVGVDVGADPDVDQFALLGLADSYNVTLIYENYGFSGRLAYNWRDKYLAQTNRGAGARNPVFFEPFGTLDLNLSYDVTRNVSISFEAINLTSESVRSYGREESNLFFAQELKPRYYVGARFNF